MKDKFKNDIELKDVLQIQSDLICKEGLEEDKTNGVDAQELSSSKKDRSDVIDA